MCSSSKISIIIPTHNNRNLDYLINSIKSSNYKNYEIIIVNENKERSCQRNIGASKSEGKYLLFLDSDMSISPNLLEECVRLMEWHDGLYIPEIIVGHPYKTFFRSFYNTTRIDAIRFLKKEYFIPFDENITGFEDWDFDRRFKGNKGITKNPLFHHHKGGTVKKKLYYSKWLKIYKEKYPNCPELSIKYRLWTVFIERGKWKKFLSLHHFLNQILAVQKHLPKI